MAPNSALAFLLAALVLIAYRKNSIVCYLLSVAIVTLGVEGMIGYALMTEEDYAGQLDAEGQRYLAQIRSQSNRMSSLIDDLLRFSRLGRQPVRKEKVDMNAQVADTIKEGLAMQAQQPPEVDVEDPPPAWPTRPCCARCGST